MSKWSGPGWEARICYVRAFDDPQWREQNGLPPKKKRVYPISKTEQRRIERMNRGG